MAYNANERMRATRLRRKAERIARGELPAGAMSAADRAFLDSYKPPRPWPRVIDVKPEPASQLPPPSSPPTSSSSSPPIPPSPDVPPEGPNIAAASSSPAPAPPPPAPLSNSSPDASAAPVPFPPASSSSSSGTLAPLTFADAPQQRDGLELPKTLDEANAKIIAHSFLWLVSWIVKITRPDRERITATPEEVAELSKHVREIVERRFPHLAPYMNDWSDITGAGWTTMAYYGRGIMTKPGAPSSPQAPAPAQLPPPSPPIESPPPIARPTNGAARRNDDSL